MTTGGIGALSELALVYTTVVNLPVNEQYSIKQLPYLH